MSSMNNWSTKQIRKEVYEINSEGLFIGMAVILDGNTYAGRTFIDTRPPSYLMLPKWNGSQWIEGEELNTHRTAKIKELSEICEQKIIDGFVSSNGHTYRTNRDDQVNMIGQKDALTIDNTISTVYWRAEDVGSWIPHTREEWLIVYNEAYHHKQSTLMRYNELKNKVLEEQNYDIITLVKWEEGVV